MSNTSPPDPVMELCGASPVTCLAFEEKTAPDSKSTLFSGHQNGKILCWNLTTQRISTSFEGHAESVLWIVSPKPGFLITQGREGVLKIWAAVQSSWKLEDTISTAAFIFCNSSILELMDHHLLFVPVEESGTVCVHFLQRDFTLNTGLSGQRLKPSPQKEHGMCMKMCAFKQKDCVPRFLVAYESGSLILWDVRNCAILNKVQAHTDSVMCLAISLTKDPHVFKAFTGSVDTDLKSWLVSDETLTPDHSVSLTNPGLGSLASRKDGRIVASGGWDGLCRLFTANKLRPLVVLSNHKESIQCVTFSPDKRLAAGSKDGYISLWDVYSEK